MQKKLPFLSPGNKKCPRKGEFTNGSWLWSTTLRWSFVANNEPNWPFGHQNKLDRIIRDALNWIIIWTSWDIEYAGTRLTTSGTRLHQYHFHTKFTKFFTIFINERNLFIMIYHFLWKFKIVKNSVGYHWQYKPYWWFFRTVKIGSSILLFLIYSWIFMHDWDWR